MMSFVVVACVEMPLESSGFTEARFVDGGMVESREIGVARFLYYGPFDNEAEATRYASVVDGHIHELVAPLIGEPWDGEA